jgi:hypothetical protein
MKIGICRHCTGIVMRRYVDNVDAISLTRLNGAHPLLVSRAQQADIMLVARGINFRITEVIRTRAQQQIDYDNHSSNAEPGHSWHQYGCALDGCPMVNDEPDWNVTGANWLTVYNAWLAVGLRSGSTFTSFKGDNDHAQLMEIPESPTAEDVELLVSGGMAAVWAKYTPRLDAPLIPPAANWPESLRGPR